MATKPTAKLNWTLTNPSVRVEPSVGKKESGYAANERPTYEEFNWALFNLSEWENYLEEATDELIAVAPNTLGIYAAIVGSGGVATHSTLLAALSDAAVGPGARVYVMANHAETVNTQIQCSKNDMVVECGPGVVFTFGTAPVCMRVTALRFTLMGGRFVNFSKGISFDAVSRYGKVKDSFFNTVATEVEDLTPTTETIIVNTITE